jgi:hypothetical protein
VERFFGRSRAIAASSAHMDQADARPDRLRGREEASFTLTSSVLNDCEAKLCSIVIALFPKEQQSS